MSTMISGFVKKTLRKLGLGGRRRRHAKKGGEDEKVSFGPMQTRKGGRRHRRRGGEEPKMSFAPMQTRKAGRRHRRW
jgi:hypothetical protein